MSIFCLILKKMSMILYSMSKFSCLKSPRKFSFQNYLLVRFVTMICENVASDYGGGIETFWSAYNMITVPTSHKAPANGTLVGGTSFVT